MGDFRHATDRQKTVVVAGCPNGCQAFELETEGVGNAVDELVEKVREAFDTCEDCGEPIGTIRRDEPTEVLE